MKRFTRNPVRTLAALAVLAVAALVAGLVATRSSGARGQPVVRTTRNAALAKTILVTLRGRTLYSLSAERGGRFVCSDTACLAVWKPLRVARGTSPAGVSGLSVVTRPDMTRQVAYRGAPLYTFSHDRRSGDVRGNGFRDVGVWRPATVERSTTAPAAPSQPAYGY